MHPSAPERTHISPNAKTNPPPLAPAAPPLSLRQHAAIRYLVRGYPVGKIARHLGVSRHTIKRWKHDAPFAAEIERLRREMTAAIIAPAAKASPPPRAMDPLAAFFSAQARVERSPAAAPDAFTDDEDDEDEHDDEEEEMSDEEAADIEAWVEDVIRAKHAGEEIPPLPPPRSSL